jgi:nucleoside-diphosphate-sugar epimerase
VPVPGGWKHDAEERQGKDLVDAALKNNIKHFVYTSADRGGDASIETPTRIPHFISKHNIEHHLIDQAKRNGMTWTILRPTAFLQNFTPDFFGKVFTTCWKIAVKEKPLQVISVTDVGFFGAQAFLVPGKYTNKCLSLAGDELTFAEMENIFRAKCKRDVPLTFNFVSRILMWMSKDFGYMFQWFYDSGFGADIPALKKIRPEMQTFESWLESESGFVAK